MVENSQEYRLKYWATRSSVRSFARTAHSFACSGLLASLHPPLRSLVCSLAHFAHSLARGTEDDWMAILSVFFSIFDHSDRCFWSSPGLLVVVIWKVTRFRLFYLISLLPCPAQSPSQFRHSPLPRFSTFVLQLSPLIASVLFLNILCSPGKEPWISRHRDITAGRKKSMSTVRGMIIFVCCW